MASLLAVIALTQFSFGQGRSVNPQVRQAPPNQTSPAPQASAPVPRIGVIDINHIFKNHERFKQMIEDMKKDVEAFEAQLNQRGKELQKMREQLDEHRPGSETYKRIEEQMAGFQARVQADTQLKRKEFLEREAKVYYDVYEEIVNEVTLFSQQNRLDLVVRFNSETIDPQNRKSVLEGVNRAVVFHNRLNITYPILDRLNRGTAPQAQPQNNLGRRANDRTIPR
jgi:Skp family chaperone for outer membrane proteins